MKSIDVNRQIETNMFESWKAWFASDLNYLKYEDNLNFFKYKTGIKYPLANGIFNAKVAQELIPELIKSFKSENLPFIWLISPSSKPINLSELLIDNGLNLLSESTGMAMKLNKLETLENNITNLEMVKVNTHEDLNEWAKVALIGNGYQLELIYDFFTDALYPKIFKEKSLMGAFLGYYDKKPVSSSFVYYAGGVAGIYWVSTLETARNKGIGTAITLAALQDAKRLGYDTVVLQSSDMAFKMYKRMGFQEYNKYQIFGWIPNSNY